VKLKDFSCVDFLLVSLKKKRLLNVHLTFHQYGLLVSMDLISSAINLYVSVGWSGINFRIAG
jgi:hypothetical protein